MAQIALHPDFRDFLRLLNSHRVEYLIVGGYAVGYHGYPRATGDFISLDDLKVNKKACARHKTLEDLDHLP